MVAPALLGAAILVFAACGDDGAAPNTAGASTTQTETERAQFGLRDDDTIRYAKPRSQEPKVSLPSGPPPRQLKTKDLREGTGEEVDLRDEAIVNYVGYHYSTKRKYDTSYGSDLVPYKVYPGEGHMIDGFEQGIVGMKVGGLRMITIPPRLGYGERGYLGQVKPGETLVFVVELEAVEKRE